MSNSSDGLSIVVAGASGDLARKKIFPALFALYCQDCLPANFQVFGFARSDFDNAEFRNRIMAHLSCRYSPGESCDQKMDEFLGRCHYQAGSYGSADSFLDLFTQMRGAESGRNTDRLFYLAIPPSVFLDVARAIGDAGLVSCGSDRPWSRVVLEKPFGRDRETSDQLTQAMAQVFTEDQTYRIDHYLGKEVIQNLLVLRFANLVFEPIWNRSYIRRVEIQWKENLDLAGRGGYFDQYGIIRDVMQNHLLQVLALVAMEPPKRLSAASIAREKTRVLRCISPAKREDMVIGQFTEATVGQHRFPAYIEDDTVPDNSLTPTFAAARLQIDNPRWNGVPFLITAGKGLDARMTEIRVEFHDVPSNMFYESEQCPDANELVIRVQPDESIHLSLVNKVPGMGMSLESRNLDLNYKSAFTQQIPDAYESLLLDVIEGDRSLFVQREELEAAWNIFTPVLYELEETQAIPASYPFGGSGPEAAESLLG
jgi:glucose-6-phosphate 1-dehydrogenase